jgi:hypothetical protein
MRIIVVAGAVAALLCAPAVSQKPRTPHGHPDFQGLWLAEYLTPMERHDDIKDLVVAPADAAAVAKKLTPDLGEVYDPEANSYFSTTLMSVNGELRSSWIVEPANGKLPLTALARAATNGAGPEYDNPEERPAPERCLDSLAHPPFRAATANIPYLFVQTPDAFVVAAEDMNPLRIIDLSGRAHPPAIRTRSGDSNGRWEGDTLVVETDGFAAVDPSGVLARDAALVSEGSRVIERLSLLPSGQLLYQFTVEDPALYTQPWRAELVLNRMDGQFLEYACHEGNSSMASILTAARLGRQKTKDQK